MSRRLSALEFDAITIEGGLLPAEWLANIASLKAPQQSVTDYDVPRGLNLRDELGRYWRIAQAHWADFAAARARAEDPQALARRFMVNLFRDVFAASDIHAHAEPTLIGEHHYPIAASARDGRLPLIVAAAGQRLDERDRCYGDHNRQRSAFGLLQDYLNAADHALWGVASNGLLLRLARDNASLSLGRINWRDMGPEELGSVYESLLELVPQISTDGRRFGFASADESRGNARKTSGSYYTPDSLVQELLDSALEPVIRQRIAGATDPQAALLSITVCDPACGSGHFLLGAARRLATHLAQLRAQGTPSGDDFRHALRDVIAHCIHGVDRNPMALELARMSLWLEAMTPDRPLGFLDHHLQCGDALLGLTDLAALEHGIPKDAFRPLSGDDKDVCKALAKTNAAELKDLERKRRSHAFGQQDLLTQRHAWLDELRALEAMPDATLNDIATKQAAWQTFAEQAIDSPLRHAADMLLAAFLLPKTQGTHAQVPTAASVLLELMGEHAQGLQAGKRQAAHAVCSEARVLHWPLTFPLVYASGGFTCMLGNPPWERIKLQEEEFFASRNRDVAEAKNKAERSQRIQWLSEGTLAVHLDPDSGHCAAQMQVEQRLYAEFLSTRRIAEATSLFAHVDGKEGGRYPLTGVGDVNTYALFAETIIQITTEAGRAGFIVPTGIATDDSTKAYFVHITSNEQLVSLLSLYEVRAWFKGTDDRKSFCLVTLGNARSAKFLFDAKTVEDFSRPDKWFTLTVDDFHLINPNTLTCPVFRSKHDAELTKRLYHTTPVLVDESRVDGNPWGIRFMTMFHMSNDSRLFTDEQGEGRLPLYEAKLMHQFDHRWATYDAGGNSRGVTIPEKVDPDFVISPRYWVAAREVTQLLIDKGRKNNWLMGWRDIALRSVERTVISTVMPSVGINHKTPLWFAEAAPSVEHVAALLGNFNALILDYVARQKIGGTSLTYFYLKQFPFLPPDRYTTIDLAFIVQRVLELTYTAHDLKSWAQDLGFDGPPFAFDPDRRAQLRAELDAYYARLYGLTRDELRYILDPADIMGVDYPSETFRVLKDKEIREFGQYRTQHLVLREFDRMTLADARGEALVSLLDPPPGDQAQPSYSLHGVIRDAIDARLAGLLLTMIQRHSPLSRRQMTDSLAMMAEPALLAGIAGSFDATADVVAAFRQRHSGICDADRLGGDRIQNWMRHFESVGVIRTDSQSGRFIAVPNAAFPGEAVVDDEAINVADILIQAVTKAAVTDASGDARESDASIKQA